MEQTTSTCDNVNLRIDYPTRVRFCFVKRYKRSNRRRLINRWHYLLVFDQELKVFGNIGNKLTNAEELWQKFKDIYLTKSWKNRLHLKRGER